MAKNKRKFSKNSVKKIQKIKSLNKAIHFLSPSASFSFSSVSFSYPKHRGSQMTKSKQKSILAKILLARTVGLDRDDHCVCYCFCYCHEDVHCYHRSTAGSLVLDRDDPRIYYYFYFYSYCMLIQDCRTSRT